MCCMTLRATVIQRFCLNRVVCVASCRWSGKWSASTQRSSAASGERRRRRRRRRKRRSALLCPLPAPHPQSPAPIATATVPTTAATTQRAAAAARRRRRKRERGATAAGGATVGGGAAAGRLASAGARRPFWAVIGWTAALLLVDRESRSPESCSHRHKREREWPMISPVSDAGAATGSNVKDECAKFHQLLFFFCWKTIKTFEKENICWSGLLFLDKPHPHAPPWLAASGQEAGQFSAVEGHQWVLSYSSEYIQISSEFSLLYSSSL